MTDNSKSAKDNSDIDALLSRVALILESLDVKDARDNIDALLSRVALILEEKSNG